MENPQKVMERVSALLPPMRGYMQANASIEKFQLISNNPGTNQTPREETRAAPSTIDGALNKIDERNRPSPAIMINVNWLQCTLIPSRENFKKLSSGMKTIIKGMQRSADQPRP
jgi:hypothetical protein